MVIYVLEMGQNFKKLPTPYFGQCTPLILYLWSWAGAEWRHMSHDKMADKYRLKTLALH